VIYVSSFTFPRPYMIIDAIAVAFGYLSGIIFDDFPSFIAYRSGKITFFLKALVKCAGNAYNEGHVLFFMLQQNRQIVKWPKGLNTEIVYLYTMTVLHYPKLDSILMVEKAIQKADYPTRMDLWRSLPKKMQYQTFKLILDYLERSNKIMFQDNKIIWIFANSEKLNQLIDEAVTV
jgi:hypothetical protein